VYARKAEALRRVGRTLLGLRHARTLSGWMSPAMMRRMVDLPVPLGPMMPTASPRRLHGGVSAVA
jgi:hypothetical protein